MGLSEDGEDVVESQFEELCLDLNMDKKAKDEAFENYQKILENYSLEACFNRNLSYPFRNSVPIHMILPHTKIMPSTSLLY